MKSRSEANLGASVWAMSRKMLGKDGESASALARTITPILGYAAVSEFLRRFPQPPSSGSVTALDDGFSAEYRRSNGIYFTPPELARDMALWLPQGSGFVVDPACGDGELLVASARLGHAVWGIEQELVAAVAAAVRLAAMGANATITWGDGLDPKNWPARTKSAIANPPYVGEKGNKAFFSAIRRRWPDLEDAYAARMDLSYFFWWRIIERCRHAVLLVSEYWQWADSAGPLRAKMSELPVSFVFSLGSGHFSSAKGHHSCVVIADGSTSRAKAFDVSELPPPSQVGTLAGVPLSIEFDGVRRSLTQHHGERLPVLLKDFQGFVSGFDGRGRGFLTDVSACPGLYLRPVLRATDCAANRVWLAAPSHRRVIWADQTLSEVHQRRLQAWFGAQGRARLSRRREVVLGRIDWYRLHWPRNRADMTGPKLVIPRRAANPCFTLDLSGSSISSDCTYLTAPDSVDDPVPYLLRLMFLLNREETSEQLRDFGKRKGTLFEFYASPLKRIRVAPRDLNDEQKLEGLVSDALEGLFRCECACLDLK